MLSHEQESAEPSRPSQQATMNVFIPNFEHFNSELEPFDSYLERFECHTEVYNLDDGKKVRFLITCIGPELYTKLRTVAWPQKPTELKFTEIVNLLKPFLSPTPVTSIERQRFRARVQGPNETYLDFLADLKKLSSTCGFVGEERLKEELRDQIIFGIRDKATQNYFLRTKDLTYSMVHDKAFADEQASVGVTLLNQSQGSFNDTQGTVNKIDSMYKNGATISFLGEEAIRKYQRLRNVEFHDEKIQDIRRARGGVILDPLDLVNDVLDDNDFITVSLSSDVKKSSIIPEELKFVLDPLPNSFEPSDEFIFLDGSSLFIEDLQKLGRGAYKIKLTHEAEENIKRSRALIDKILNENKVIYGITTGFGNFARTNIEKSKLEELQCNVIRSHAAGVGNPLSPERTRMLLALRINVLAKGYSGISLQTMGKLINAFNASCLSYVPEQGSVGASGDLAPLSHLALGLMGEGKMWSPSTGWGDATEVLAANGLTPMTLLAKEGICLINGTQLITSLGAEAVERAEMVARQADVIAALTLEVLKGTSRAFDSDVQAVRPHKGQIAVAKRLRALLHSETYPSQIAESHRFCNRVQDAYTLRCCPQVHGIVHDTIDFIKQVVTVEINSATDNPIVFAERGEIISAGNFHGEYPAKALDFLAVGVHELASMSERRIERLVNPALSELPAFLVKDGGLNSGFMLAHCTAASLVSENKVLCHPSSVDSLSTSAAQEDHVSMGCFSARKALQVVENVEHVLAIELLAACQAIEFLRPLKTTVPLEEVYNTVRSVVRPLDKDRFMSPDIEAATKLLKDNKIWSAVKHHIDYYHEPLELETRVFSPTAVMVGENQREPPKTQKVSPRGSSKRKRNDSFNK